jgi:hypothetical protein
MHPLHLLWRFILGFVLGYGVKMERELLSFGWISDCVFYGFPLHGFRGHPVRESVRLYKGLFVLLSILFFVSCLLISLVITPHLSLCSLLLLVRYYEYILFG